MNKKWNTILLGFSFVAHQYNVCIPVFFLSFFTKNCKYYSNVFSSSKPNWEN